MRATRSRAAAGPSKAGQDNAHSPVQIAADPSPAAAAQTAALAQHAVASALPLAAAVTARAAAAATAATAANRAAKLSREAVQLMAQNSRFGNQSAADNTTAGRRTRQRIASECPSSNGDTPEPPTPAGADTNAIVSSMSEPARSASAAVVQPPAVAQPLGQAQPEAAAPADAKPTARSKKTARKSALAVTGTAEGSGMGKVAGAAKTGAAPLRAAGGAKTGAAAALPAAGKAAVQAAMQAVVQRMGGAAAAMLSKAAGGRSGARAARSRAKSKKPAKSAAVAMEEDSDGSDYNPDSASASESSADSQVVDLVSDSEAEGILQRPSKRQRTSGAGAGKATGKRPAKKQKGGQAARDAIKAAAKQRRKEKKAAAASVAPEDENAWGPFDARGREIGETDEEDSDVEEEPFVLQPMPAMEAPGEIVAALLPYQREFLAWAVGQERSSVRGGILADEMGMGKTLQAITLIVTHRTDDMSKLPPVQPPDQAAKPKQAAAAPRPKLALLSARRPDGAGNAAKPVPDMSAADVVPSTLAVELPPVVPEEGKLEQDDDGLEWETVEDEARPSEGVQPGTSCCKDHAAAPKNQDADAPGVGTTEQASSSGGYGRATLVVCPLVAVLQWRQEIERFTQPNTLKVVVFHGSKRTADAAELAGADVVLTTYSIIEGEHRRYVEPDKIPCKYCSRKFQPERLDVHLRFFCGPNAKKSAALAKQQKKRPRGDGKSKAAGGKAAAAGSGSEDNSSDGSNSDEGEEDDEEGEEEEVPKKGKKVAAGKGKGVKKGSGKANGKGKGKKKGYEKDAKGKGKATKDDGDPDFSESDESAADESEGEDSDDANDERSMKRKAWKAAWRAWRASGGQSNIKDEASKEAAEMIAKAKAKAKATEGPGVSVLHEVAWRRVVLDEAHSIKDRRCSTARAVFALNSKYKWALSGTPLQNRVGELYSLIRFLRIFPYAFYFCGAGTAKSSKEAPCTCKCIDYPFSSNHRKCNHCGHSPLHHYCWWNKHVANPIKKWGYVGKGRKAMLLLKHQILPKILLRRTKVQCADVLALPPRTVVMRKDAFDEREADFYEALYTQSQAQFGAYVQAGTVVNNYAHIFDLLIRLRQAVDHPYLVVHSASGAAAAQAASAKAAAAKSAADDDGDLNGGMCGVCHDPLEQPVVAACGHAFCRVCLAEYLDGCTGVAGCPSCQRPLSVDLTAASPAPARVAGARKASILNRLALGEFQSSTKIEALREELHRTLQRDPSAKALVFSQFTSMLDLIFFRLQQVGIRCVRLEGSMTMDARNRMIDAFSNDPAVTVFLMSLKAGGVALNLTAASHVMLMDPWWNPAVEQQAQDRIHRLGQFKPIAVHRFIIAGTIEERILKLQEKKQLVFEGTVGRDAEALGRLTEDDLRFLFA
ncbi:probable ATP-dependent helicase rhp16 [Coccomyxa sp. Obi]|nr:probable ATP-dependent helicase rhp16 [Coccomyxa sp. Obi]